VGVAGLSLLAIFLERTVLVFPSVIRPPAFPYGVIEVLVTVGFGALFALSHALVLPRLGLAGPPAR